MAHQLVYTSAPKLLEAGRSGFGTVARSKAIPPLAVGVIERFSQFANLRGTDRTRFIFTHRRVTAGNNRFHLLTRIRDAGSDYTGRTNHIAHHLFIPVEEVARAEAAGITPADVMRQFAWLERWDGPARFLDPSDEVAIPSFRPLCRESRRATWIATTGHPSHARVLAWDGAPRTGVLVVPEASDVLGLLGEALAEFGRHSWSRSFTTWLESNDELSDLDWIVAVPSHLTATMARCGSRTVIDLTKPAGLPVPPELPAAAVQNPVENAPVHPAFADRVTGVEPAVEESGTAPGQPRQAVKVRIAAATRNAGASPAVRRAPLSQGPPPKRATRMLGFSLAAVGLLIAATTLTLVHHKRKAGNAMPLGMEERLNTVAGKLALPADDVRKIKEEAGGEIAAWVSFLEKSETYFPDFADPQRIKDPFADLETRFPTGDKLPDKGPPWLRQLSAGMAKLRDVGRPQGDPEGWFLALHNATSEISNAPFVGEARAYNLFCCFARDRLRELLASGTEAQVAGRLKMSFWRNVPPYQAVLMETAQDQVKRSNRTTELEAFEKRISGISHLFDPGNFAHLKKLIADKQQALSGRRPRIPNETGHARSGRPEGHGPRVPAEAGAGQPGTPGLPPPPEFEIIMLDPRQGAGELEVPLLRRLFEDAADDQRSKAASLAKKTLNGTIEVGSFAGNVLLQNESELQDKGYEIARGQEHCADAVITKGGKLKFNGEPRDLTISGNTGGRACVAKVLVDRRLDQEQVVSALVTTNHPDPDTGMLAIEAEIARKLAAVRGTGGDPIPLGLRSRTVGLSRQGDNWTVNCGLEIEDVSFFRDEIKTRLENEHAEAQQHGKPRERKPFHFTERLEEYLGKPDLEQKIHDLNEARDNAAKPKLETFLGYAVGHVIDQLKNCLTAKGLDSLQQELRKNTRNSHSSWEEICKGNPKHALTAIEIVISDPRFQPGRKISAGKQKADAVTAALRQGVVVATRNDRALFKLQLAAGNP